MDLNVKHKTSREKKIEKFQYLGLGKKILDVTTTEKPTNQI